MFEQIVSFSDSLPVRFKDHSVREQTSHGEQLIGMHMHKVYEILLITRGILKCVTLEDEFFAETGDILFVNPNIPHSTYDHLGGERHHLLQFNSPIPADNALFYLSRFSKSIDTPVRVFKKGSAEANVITEAVLSIGFEIEAKAACWEDIITATLNMLIARLRRFGIITTLSGDRVARLERIKPAVDFINDNYSSNISTSDISAMLNFNEIYFCRLFKELVGTNMTDYLNFVRVSKAEQLLETDKSLSEIAYESGFSSHSYFNRIFKKYKGMSPGEYRKLDRN